MAYERTSDSRVKGDTLDAFVENLSKTYSRQVTLRNAEDELNFNKAVLEQNLSLEDQLSYRQDQLKRVSDDPTEKARIKGEISSLKDRIEQRKFSDEYLDKLITFESGLSSIDTVISWLEAQKATATDQSIKDAINKELVSKNQEKFKITKEVMTNQTQYAIKDKTASVLDTQISKVSAEKSKAMLAGNDELVSIYDLQLQSLKKAKTEATIESSIKNFSVSTMTGFSSATKLLDAYNANISNAADTGPVTIGDVTYSSAREFWTFKRDSFVADQSSSGFFARLNDEINTKIKVANSKNALTSSLLTEYTKEADRLSTRPELQGYDLNINAVKQDALQSGTNFLTDSIINKYAVDYDLNKAIGEINSLKSLGVNVDSAYTKIITAGANVKQSQVNNILSAAQTALQNDPSLTPEAALMKAIQTGAAIVKSPEQLATKSESDLAKEFSSTATQGTGDIDPRLTVNQGAQSQPQQQQQPQQSQSFKTITIKAGDTLSGIAARELGSASKFNELASLNNIADPNKISVGMTLKIPVASAPSQPSIPSPKPAPAPVPTAQPAPQPQPQPQPVVQPTPQAPATPSNYLIKSGDTLGRIAAQNNTTVDALVKLNNIADPNKIIAGKTIRIK